MRLLFGLLLALTLAQGLVFAQAPPATNPSSLKARLDSLAGGKSPQTDQAVPRQETDQALEQLAAAEESERKLQELRKLLDAAPAQIARARTELARLEAAPAPAPARDPAQPLPALEKDFDAQSTRLDELQRALAEANSLIIGAQTRPDRAQAEIQSGQARLAAIADALRRGRDGGRPLTQERRDLLTAESRALEAAGELRRLQLSGNDQLQQLGQARRDLIVQQIARQERELQALRARINELRRERSEQTVAELSDDLRRGLTAPGEGQLLARETAINLQLSEFLLRATDRLNDLTQRNLQARQQLDALNQTEGTLEEQISVLQGSLLLTRILYEQKQALPRLSLDPKLADQIADLRLYQFEINRHREQLGDPVAYAERLASQEAPGAVDAAQRQDLLALIETRATLLGRLNRELGLLVTESYGLQLTQRQLQTTADRLRATLDEQMFWVPSNRPLDFAWLQALPVRLWNQAASIPWRGFGRDLADGLKARPWAAVLAVAVLALAAWRRRAIRHRLALIHTEVAFARDDNQRHTPHALLLILLQSLTLPALLVIVGLALEADRRGYNAELGAALLDMGLALLVFGVARRLLVPGGIAEVHFDWSAPSVARSRRWVDWLGWVVFILAAVVAFAERRPAALGEDAAGIVVVLACLSAMAWLLGHLILDESGAGNSPWRMLGNLVLGMLPLALGVAIFFGYYYTSLKLTGRLIDTLYVLFAWRVLEALAVRSLAVAARRLSAQRETRRRLAAVASGELLDAPLPDDAQMRDIAQINQQSLRLVRGALLGGLVFALWLVWADLLSLFSYLENVTLYEYSSGVGDKAVLVPLNLRDLLMAVAIAAGAVVLARNLPGLLEVLVLSRLRLAQGSAYAITTLVSYVIAGIGLVATLSTLGVSWDKLQWLVAALSVGLGFGLQEIFANFISGLIILFERPARIGDVVTIGNLSGTVSRIQIRATTITDFDRKEIIVPNKTFVTDHLVNWTLSDTVTRLTIVVGVAHGSDLELVRSLLLRIARENPRVLPDPEPTVVFQSFGTSTLDHELRVHVRELGDRLAAIDEINRRIDEVFRAHGIVIAFGQMDVHIRSFSGPEVLRETLPVAAKRIDEA